MKIAFFGDSFCSEVSNPHSLFLRYETYIKKIKDYYSADIVNLGYGGSSVWDVVLNQYPKFQNESLDVLIFCWTDYARLYHPSVRDLTYNNLLDKKFKDLKLSDFLNPSIINAAKKYFENIYDQQKHELEYISLLYYFDHTVLSKISKETKIVHLWSFQKNYNWTNGKELSMPLIKFVDKDRPMSANHIDGEIKNSQVFQLIKNLIDN